MKRGVLASLLTVLVFAVTGPNAAAQDVQQELAAASTLEEIKKRGTIRVGFSTFVPWAMRNKKGEFIGFEIDVARKLAEDNGWTVEQIPTAWDGIIPALLAKKFDDHFTAIAKFAWFNSDGDGYVGEVGLIRSGGVIVAGS